MKSSFPCLIAAALAASATALPRDAAAAQAYDNCTAFIDSLPAVITSQGMWCLRKDLSTSMSGGNAIDIQANNVTIDCNHFKLGNLSAPHPFEALGIYAANRGNIVVRNCVVRGFFSATFLVGGYGHLVEDNRVDGARSAGLWVDGDQSVVRRNIVADIGLGGSEGGTSGIIAQGDNTLIEGNYVSGITGTSDPEGNSDGIVFNGIGSLVRGNFISTVLPGAGIAAGIRSNVGYMGTIDGNVIVNPNDTAGHGMDVPSGASAPICADNRVRNFTTSAFDTCIDGGGNVGE
jgi:hypothetical protein